MKRFITICLCAVAASLAAFSLPAQDYSEYLSQVDGTPFIVISKKDFTLTLVGDDGKALKQYGCALAKNFGPKEKRGDHKTPEGKFKINELLNSKSIPHDFHDGKGPIVGAYGPWFLRLDVPGFRDIGIHGTHLPESIGSRATEGCIRLKNEDILDLKSRVRLGTIVFILPEGK